jgi:hypothetical protein
MPKDSPIIGMKPIYEDRPPRSYSIILLTYNGPDQGSDHEQRFYCSAEHYAEALEHLTSIVDKTRVGIVRRVNSKVDPVPMGTTCAWADCDRAVPR